MASHHTPATASAVVTPRATSVAASPIRMMGRCRCESRSISAASAHAAEMIIPLTRSRLSILQKSSEPCSAHALIRATTAEAAFTPAPATPNECAGRPHRARHDRAPMLNPPTISVVTRTRLIRSPSGPISSTVIPATAAIANEMTITATRAVRTVRRVARLGSGCEKRAMTAQSHARPVRARVDAPYPKVFSIRVLPSVFGFTCARSRNSATPSSGERMSWE